MGRGGWRGRPVRLHGAAESVGRVLYTDYVYPFELASLVLLVAMVAAVSLTLRKRKGTKYIDPALQVAVKREGRVELVKMQAEKE